MNRSKSIISNMLIEDLILAFRKNFDFLDKNKETYERTFIVTKDIKTKHVSFNIDEQTIIKAFVDDPPDRNKFLNNIIKQLAGTPDKNIVKIIHGIIKKVVNMTDEQFANINLSEALDQSDFR